jgi:hypothetical protein
MIERLMNPGAKSSESSGQPRHVSKYGKTESNPSKKFSPAWKRQPTNAPKSGPKFGKNSFQKPKRTGYAG